MLAKCIGNSPYHLSNDREKQAYARNIHQDEVWLEIGKEYEVYGISFMDGEDIPWFLICEDNDEYPKPHLGAFFDMLDSDIPSGWAFTFTKNNAGEVALLPKLWATDPCFLEKLDDGDEDALSYFHQLGKHSKIIQS